MDLDNIFCCEEEIVPDYARNRKQEMKVPKRRVAGGELFFVQDEWDAFIFNHRYVCYKELLLSF